MIHICIIARKGAGGCFGRHKCSPQNRRSAENGASRPHPNRKRPTLRQPTYGYDDAGRLTNIAHAHAVSGVIDDFVCSLDANGNRIGVTSNSGSELYTLDVLNRLTDVSYGNGDTEAFGYDQAGNRTSHALNGGPAVASTFDAAGQLVSQSDGTTYSYDDAGNLTSTAAGESYGWDAFNRMTSAIAGGVTQSYAYDATDVRVDVDGVSQVWDRAGGLPQLISAGPDAYLHPNGQYLATITAGGGTAYGLADAMGSVRHVTSDTGVVTGGADYSVYGETRNGAVDGFGFTGEQHDPTGLLHLRARQYQPGLGQFLSVDTLQPNGVPQVRRHPCPGSSPDPRGASHVPKSNSVVFST